MTSRDFCYWLQGSLEVGKLESLDKDQLDTVRNHLNLVFKHEIDPQINATSLLKPSVLQQIHDGKVNHGQGPDGVTYRC